MYRPDYTSQFYDAYVQAEWSRLEATAYGRLQAIIHTDFIQRYIHPGDRVLDAGSGPGRFTIEMAKIGAITTVLDISAQQLELAKKKLSETALLSGVDEFIQGDIADLSRFPDNHFDSTVCFGGAISYTCEKRFEAIGELIRVTKPGGYLLISVMGRMGVRNVVRKGNISILEDPDENAELGTSYWSVLETGDLPGFDSRIGIRHPAMHLFTAEELMSLFKGCDILEVAGSNVTASEISSDLEAIAQNPKAWETVVKLEKKANTDPGLVNSGTHIILVTRNK
jgi:ubiquinone/menaquinone biosynthesis C-methylase UbiE